MGLADFVGPCFVRLRPLSALRASIRPPTHGPSIPYSDSQDNNGYSGNAS